MNSSIQTTRPKLAMNVKGITPTLFEAGKVKIGRKGKQLQGQNGPYQQPEKLDHFLITRTLRGQDNNFLVDEALIAALPKDQDGKLRRIPITLLYDDLSLNFQSRYACYLGKTLFCSGDGEFASEAVPDQNKKIKGYKQVPCTCHRAEFGYDGRDKCKITGKLQFVIRGAERIGGVHVFRTTGRNSVVSILSSLAMIQRITGGFLAGIPLDLVVNPKAVADPNGTQQTVYVVAVEFAGDMQALQDQAHKFLLSNESHRLQIRRIEEEARALLTAQPAPFGEDLDDDERDEFFPNKDSELPAGQPVPQEVVGGLDAAISEAQSETTVTGRKRTAKEKPLRNQEQLTDEDFKAESKPEPVVVQAVKPTPTAQAKPTVEEAPVQAAPAVQAPTIAASNLDDDPF